MDNLVYWIWLSLSCTVGTGTFPKLLEKFRDAKEVYDADEYSIIKCLGPKLSDRAYLVNKDLEKAEEIYAFCKKFNVGIVTYGDDCYPEALRKIQIPPVLLYYRGVFPDFKRNFCVSIVGTRSLSDYGRKNAFKISYDLATAGATIVSGMALGIDSVALAGALAAEKPTVAVLGSGIDICYPAQHLTLAREIVKCGCVITEFPPKTPPAKFNFPKRNRIISGLSAATFVVEGKENSGALITARSAKEQDRAVFALPGNVGSGHSEVTNLLLKNGARPCTSAEDILTPFEKDYQGIINPFLLKSRCDVDMMYVLSTLEVVANCPGDDIYFPPRPGRKSKDTEKDVFSGVHSKVQESKSVEPPSSFDKEALKIYKKLPLREECNIEDLIDSEHSLRDVMKLLLKLEMGKFVVILPGEKVARKRK